MTSTESGLNFTPKQFTLEEWNEREYAIAEKTEELESQKEELNAAIEELISKNEYLSRTLQELSQRKNELDQLIYRMSHDLRTPVSSILGVCHIMSLEGLPELFHPHLNQIQKQGMEMNCILNALGSFAQASLDPVVYDDVNVRALILSVLDSLQKEPGFADVTFTIDVDAGMVIHMDKQKLYLLVRNIVKNAIDFRSSTQAAKVILSVRRMNDVFTFVCEDNGVGIDDYVKPKIFTMFYRGSDLSVGSGLGLYIAKQVAQRMQGEIDVVSEPGKTLFTTTLPAPGGV